MVQNKFLGNILWLTFLQGINFIAPLIVLPYLVRVLGVEEYGLYVFSAVIVSYFGIVCDYGFNLTGTRDISIVKNDKKELKIIFSKIILIKIYLLLICCILFTITSILSSHIQENLVLYICAFSILVGQTFFPVWFFQGVEDFKFIVILNCISRIFFTTLVFLTVKNSGDAYLAALMNSLGGLVTASFAMYIIFTKYEIRLVAINIKSLLEYANKSLYIFLAQLKIALFSSANIFLLGIISGTTAVGYFSAAEKVMRALAQLQIPLLTALYPKLSLDLVNKKELSMILIKKILKFGSIVYLVLCGIVFIFAEEIILMLFGPGFEESILALQIITICPLFIFQNNIFGTQILINIGKDKTYMFVLLFAGVTNIIMSTILTFKYSFIGTSIAALTSELIVVMLMYYFAKKYFFKINVVSIK